MNYNATMLKYYFLLLFNIIPFKSVFSTFLAVFVFRCINILVIRLKSLKIDFIVKR